MAGIGLCSAENQPTFWVSGSFNSRRTPLKKNFRQAAGLLFGGVATPRLAGFCAVILPSGPEVVKALHGHTNALHPFSGSYSDPSYCSG